MEQNGLNLCEQHSLELSENFLPDEVGYYQAKHSSATFHEMVSIKAQKALDACKNHLFMKSGNKT